MTKLCKLTTSDNYTRKGQMNECLWGEGATHSGTGSGDLCGSGFIHAYEHPLLAVLLNPIHANINSPNLWLCEGEIAKREGELKVGCISLKTIKRITLPQITTEFRVRFAINIALFVYKAPAFVKWAENWLSRKDRSAWVATKAAEAEATAWAEEAEAAAWAAAWAAKAAARAAEEWAVEGAAEAAAKAAAEGAAWGADLLQIALQTAKELSIQLEDF